MQFKQPRFALQILHRPTEKKRIFLLVLTAKIIKKNSWARNLNLSPIFQSVKIQSLLQLGCTSAAVQACSAVLHIFLY